MEKFEIALAAFGGLTAVGAAIDFMMYPKEREKLKRRLEDWWLRFSYVNWSNFGRKEAEAAIQVLDVWAGARLWSWKRWRFASITCLVVFLLAVVWTLFRVVLAWGALPAGLTATQIGYLVVSAALFVATVIVSFALSITATRLIASAAAWLSRNALSTIAVFMAILIVHIVLLTYWSALVFLIGFVPLVALQVLQLNLDSGFLFGIPSFKELYGYLKDGLLLVLPRHDGWLPVPNWSHLLSLELPRKATKDWVRLPETAIYAFKTAMDLVANGIRILFALAFLGSFVFRPLIQEPVTRLWYGAINSGRPFFTLLFGAIGVVAAVTKALLGSSG